jgi:pantetheine-phosphate adenylyltransferase
MQAAIYPGSFDPITNGHLDVVRRALSLVNRVVVGVIYNPEKNPLFSLEERMDLIRTLFKDEPRVEVASFSGLLIDFARLQNVYTIIRGLRAVSDFDYEFQMAITNRHLCPKLDTVFLMTDVDYSYLSSSLVKQVARFGGDVSSFVPMEIELKLKEKLGL